MDLILSILARCLIRILQLLPLRCVVHIGRAGGALFYLLDARHRRVVVQNLTACFGSEKSPGEIRALAKENFKRIGENFASAVKTAVLNDEAMAKVLTTKGAELLPEMPRGSIGAVGHFGNFEVMARTGRLFQGCQPATTYRGIKQPRLNAVLKDLRARSGCWFFERRTEAAKLKEALSNGPIVLGLLSDQHAGKSGVDVPFFGRICATTTSPAVLALRYDLPLFVAVCFRKGPGKWEFEILKTVTTRVEGKPRAVADIMTEVNQVFESAIRRDPANWFWVHNRWKIVADGRKHRKDRVDVENSSTVEIP